MGKKIIAPAAINALKEALTNIYWYKSDLRSFIMHTISEPAILTRLNWNEYKRNIVTTLIDFLSLHQDNYLNDLLRLMTEVIKISDFYHLERLENGEDKVRKAEESVKALESLMEDHTDLIKEQKKLEERRKTAYEKSLKNRGVKEKLDELQKQYFALISNDDYQKRGYQLEKILKELFALFDLDPKASFKVTGEQIDGAFTFENTDYLLEAKWQKESVSTNELDAFSGKLGRKLENTLGLFLSINGFSEDSVKAHTTGRKLMILVDGSDLMAVLEGRIDLIQLLFRKRRHASQTGNIYLKIHEIMMGK